MNTKAGLQLPQHAFHKVCYQNIHKCVATERTASVIEHFFALGELHSKHSYEALTRISIQRKHTQ